ncbi:hypothetical protein C2845_PM17G09770 [Panicum miliaceum]|uniref:(+)-neomenthol dehydrogenase-like n=1 Tax=Panicum miliaceum TaxID=4540 RepID=A0A3L6Q2E9_PANMI|nr:hypothetical protein C2845_PM17G09770 [Panicum miliaceum]
MAPPNDSLGTVILNLEKLGKKADDTNRRIEEMQQSIQRNTDGHSSMTALKPSMEDKVSNLQNSVYDLQKKIDLFIHEIPSKRKGEEDHKILEASTPAHLGAAAYAETSGQNGHRDDNNNRSVGAGVVTTLVPSPVKVVLGETKRTQFSGMDWQLRTGWMWKYSRETYNTATESLPTNYYGTKHVTKALLPLLQSSSDGRIVNISSGFGLLRFFRSEELKQELNDADNLTEERLDELLDTFMKDYEAGALEARGWPAEFASYKVAKAAVNAYSRIIARRHPALRINCAHPGYVNTDMTRNLGFLTPEEGAKNVVKVALLPAGGPTGAFFAMGKEASFL